MLQLLLAARKRLGLTQQEMADKLGISRNYLALIETGKRRVPPHVADQLVTLKQVVVTEPSDQTQSIPGVPTSADASAARIAELERQLAAANETIHNLSVALAQGRPVVEPASGACGGAKHTASNKHERRAGA